MKKLLWIAGFAFFATVGALAALDPTIRNVYRAIYPSEHYDTVPPVVPELAEPAVLVFTKTNGFRHHAAIEAGLEAFRAVTDEAGWSLFHTENGAVFDPDLLARFRVAVWHNVSGAPVNADQRRALRGWLEQGGGWIGTHASLDASHAAWDWYIEELLGTRFIGHIMGPQFQEATVRVEDPSHPATQHLAQSWPQVEEWYSFDRSVRGDEGVEVLATVDESTYTPRLRLLWFDRDLAMGDHPILWTRSVGQGRAFFSALGHQGASYASPEVRGILRGALAWAGRLGASAGSAAHSTPEGP